MSTELCTQLIAVYLRFNNDHEFNLIIMFTVHEIKNIHGYFISLFFSREDLEVNLEHRPFSTCLDSFFLRRLKLRGRGEL